MGVTDKEWKLIKAAAEETKNTDNHKKTRTHTANTALSETSIRSSLTQESIRRLKNCSEDLTLSEKQVILIDDI